MEKLSTVKEKIKEMAELTLSMLKAMFDGFMEHDLEVLARVLKEEGKLNEMEREITLSLVEMSKRKISLADKKKIMLMTNIVADLEEIGDYVKDIVERIEIKIQEKLLFSDEALDEYKHLYNVVETGLADVEKTLRMNDNNFARHVLSNREHVDKLVQKYRDAHTQRLLSSICDPRSGNMFLNLLDFTAQISHHTKIIAKNIIGLK